jgi:hypothetical protein
MKRTGVFLAAVIGTILMSAEAQAQTTYTWNQTGSAAWTTATNWTPTRTTPAANDILVIDGSMTPTPTLTNVPTETIGRLRTINSATNVTFTATAAVTLTIGGGTGTDFELEAISALTLSGAGAISISLSSGATGSISGSMTVTGGAHRLLAVDASGMTVQSGGSFTTGTGFTGNAFGTTNLNSIVFANGSTYTHNAGANPFGAAQPNSVVVFQTGSLYRQQSTAAPSSSGRTYANFELNVAGTVTITGSSAVVMDDLTITQGTFNFNMTGTPGHSIRGNISIASSQTLNFNPASAGTVNLNGSSGQTISGSGTLTAGANSTIVVSNSTGVTLQRAIATSGALTVNSGGVLNCGTNVVSGTGSFTLAAGGTLGIGDPAGITSSSAMGNIQTTTRSFNTGANYTYNGSAAQVTGDGLPGTVNDLTINNSAGVTLTNSATVNGTLNLTSGDLMTGANMLTQNGGSTGTGDVVGTVRRTDVGVTTRAFGNPNVQITVSSGTPPNPMDVALTKSTPASFTNAVTRRYVLTDAGGLSATVRLRYLDSELNGNIEASLELFRLNGTLWTQQPKTASDTTANWAERSGVTDFSEWTLSSVSPTAVALAGFTAESGKDGLFIFWETVSEFDVAGYNLLRSASPDGPYTRINPAFMPAQAGGSLMGASYRYADPDVRSGATYYYVLEIIKLDGRSEQYGPISARFRRELSAKEREGTRMR